VEYVESRLDGERAVVRMLAWYGDDQVELDYQLERGADGRWRIVNYVVDGVDTVRNYRRQFARILQESSMADLIDRLDRHASRLEEPEPGTDEEGDPAHGQ